MEAARRYFKVEAELIEILQKIDRVKGYRQFGVASLFSYAVQVLGLSESTAYNFITVARKAVDVPALKQEIEKGAVSVSKARKIAVVLTKENQAHWLDLAKRLPQKKLEQEVAAVAPKAAVPEQASYISGDRLKLTLGVSEHLMKELKGVQDILSRKRKKAVTMEEALLEALSEYRQRHDPVAKAERASQEKPVARQAARPLSLASNERPGKVTTGEPNGRRGPGGSSGAGRAPLPAALRHQLNLRDQGRCARRDSHGNRCTNTKWLDFHHLKPVSDGGTNELANLITVCREHHRMIHDH